MGTIKLKNNRKINNENKKYPPGKKVSTQSVQHANLSNAKCSIPAQNVKYYAKRSIPKIFNTQSARKMFSKRNTQHVQNLIWSKDLSKNCQRFSIEIIYNRLSILVYYFKMLPLLLLSLPILLATLFKHHLHYTF